MSVRGGIHPVKIGDVYENYKIEKYLGQGEFSTVWKTEDNYAIKIVKSAKVYAAAAKNEIQVLSAIERNEYLMNLIDSFTIRGPNGKHYCLIVEFLGPSLVDGGALQIDIVRRYSAQLVKGLKFMQQKRIIHTDLKLENILIHNDTVKIADFGNAISYDEKKKPTTIQTRQYRAPEVILGDKYNYTADIWSLGCIIFELITGDLLFNPSYKNGITREHHLKEIIEILGNFPTSALRGKFWREFLTLEGKLRNLHDISPFPLELLLIYEYNISPPIVAEIIEFVLPMLAIENALRYIPETCKFICQQVNEV